MTAILSRVDGGPAGPSAVIRSCRHDDRVMPSRRPGHAVTTIRSWRVRTRHPVTD
ncbi:hypothetical protein AB0K49_09570 [Streptomyces decoyicus]|uniref:hypothetical protein n=1 Tax=Streptomyces decoyicus TaxID=249567 RepID=UPI00345CFF86